MKKRLLYLVKTQPIYVCLLSVFFVFHGYVENFDFVPASDALLLTTTYLLATVVLLFLSWLLYRNLGRASLITFLIISFHFCFVSVHDFLKNPYPGMFRRQ